MSLSINGVWKTGVWSQTVWADGVWREGEPIVPLEIVIRKYNFKVTMRYSDTLQITKTIKEDFIL